MRLTPSPRRELLLQTLRAHPGRSSSQLRELVLNETGGAPALMTGAVYIPAYAAYADLKYLEGRSLVWRKQPAAGHRIRWFAVCTDEQAAAVV